MSFSIKLNRVTTCDCCGQDKPVRVWKHSFEQANQFDVVFNDDKDYVELVDRCPNCGYVKYIDIDVTDEIKEYVSREDYQTFANRQDYPDWLVTWYLYAMLCQFRKDYVCAMLAWVKIYDYALTLHNKHLYDVLDHFWPCYNAYLDELGKQSGQFDNMSIFVMTMAVDVARRHSRWDDASNILNFLNSLTFDDDKDEGVISVKKNFATLANLIEKQDATTRFKFNV